MRAQLRLGRAAWLVLSVVPIALAFSHRETPDGDGPGWLDEGRGRVRVEPVGPTLVHSGVVRAATQTTMIPEIDLVSGVPPTLGTLGIALPTRIIEIVPEGSTVKEGDPICRFDPSVYEEQARLQRIEVDRCRSSLAVAERDLAVAQAELIAFREGDRVQQERRLETELAMARVELSRAEDSLSWSQRMGTLGYLASADLAEQRLARLRAEIARENAELALQTFLRTTVEKQLRDLEARVERAQTSRAFAAEALNAAEARQEHLDQQVSHCTMTAPHDGTVLYADIAWREYYQVREGAEVYPHLPLFVLPDLSRLEVEIQVHERLSSLVDEGQQATASFEAFPGRSSPARVSSVDLLPTPDWYHFGEWHQFRVRLALDEAPSGLLPEMTAEVVLQTGPSTPALTVPSVAVAWDEGGPYCVVETPLGQVLRPVRVDRGTTDRLVVLEGLESGETVLLLPRRHNRRKEGSRWPPDP
ncbi:efflux RND transporter periplasmic adaptor subunit [Tautonia rosea]|uniref:efflux RND transporter periplasmic adaptor subunit n=1 Tax=Tautonia rosea TaxID=2728037 RepID=UPI001474993E|nr:efflux RND transporter periplasmic adaptor subunit [Tautonia rosea]